MANTEFELIIATPTKVAVKKQAKLANFPTIKGMIGILPNHANIVGSLAPGFAKFKYSDGSSLHALINQGLYYFQDNKLVIMTDFFEPSCKGVDENSIAQIQEIINKGLEKLKLDPKYAKNLNQYTKLVSAKAKEANRHK